MPIYGQINRSQPLLNIFALNLRNQWGAGVHPDFFVRLHFEIAVDQKSRACEQTFERVSGSGCPS